jgi:pyrimidine deaminase RibD-like protein
MEFTEMQMRIYMHSAIKLAKQGKISKPNVGSIVFDNNGKIVGSGNRSFRDDFLIHAERNALDNAGTYIPGGTLLTTLEPCVSKGENGTQILKSCSELIYERGIIKVIIGLLDNSCTVNKAAGLLQLRNNGIEVIKYDGLESQLLQLLPKEARNSYKRRYDFR